MADGITFIDGVSLGFRSACTAGWEAMPGPVRELLGASGVIVQGVRSINEDLPEFAATPVGIGGRTAAHLQAFHRRGKIVVAERHHSLATGKVERTEDPGAYLCHEAGHAFDNAVGARLNSNSVAFRRAYQADLDAMTSARRMDLYYFAQPRVGRRETFAEAFAVAVGKPTPAFAGQFSAAFRRSAAFLHDIIRKQRKARP